MFSESAELYDLIYSWKDYRAEAEQIEALIERVVPNAKSILDVACGTGEHIKELLERRDYEITGIDLDATFVDLARAKNPNASFVQADMTGFDLGRAFDVVMCLFSSIGYVRTLENVERTLSQFRSHLNPDGVILVEPWFEPEQWKVGNIHSVVNTEMDDIKVCRMSRSDKKDRISSIEFHYLIGRPSGIEHRYEVHELGLFTRDEMTSCFKRAGLSVRYDEAGLMGRGMYIARHSA